MHFNLFYIFLWDRKEHPMPSDRAEAVKQQLEKEQERPP